MSGLECSEISINGLDYSGRMDAEYYQKFYLQLEKQILSNTNDEMGNQANFLIGPFGSAYDTSNYTDIPDYRYVRGQDVKPFVLNDIEPRYMAKNDYERLEKYALEPDDILVSVVGTLGNACIVTEKYLPAIFSCKSSVIRTNNINPYYLVCYLNSKFGHTLLVRNARGAIQQGLNLDDLKTLHIPLFSEQFQSSCEQLLFLSNDFLEQSKTSYFEAEKLLLSTLDFDKFTPSTENTSVKTFTQVIKSERLDAEYYQKKYDDLFAAIHYAAQNPNVAKVTSLESVVSIKKSIEPGSDEYCKEGIPFLRVSDISKFEINLPDIFLDRKNFDIDGLKPKKDTILFSKDGSVGIAYKANKDMDAITSSALLHLTVTDKMVNPDYLTLLLSSFIVGMQAERDVGGSILKHWRLDEIKKVEIPILKESIQKEIATKIRHSFALREQSKSLLKAATRAVEIAIEQDEAAAVEFLRETEIGES